MRICITKFNLHFACYVVMRPSYWRGGGGGTYVPSLNFKYSCSASLGVGHVPFSIEPIFMSLVGILP